MSKRKLISFDSMVGSRQSVYQYYYNKYYNLFMNAYTWEGLDYRQKDFLMRRLWSDGKVAFFILKETIGTEEYPSGMPVITSYASQSYDIYDYPIEVTLINKRGVKFIPTTPQRVDRDVVIGYSQRNKKSVSSMVEYYLQKIVDVEMTIKTNLKAQKTPYLLSVTPESESRIEALWDSLDSDNPRLFVGVDDAENINALNTGATYNIDKLYAYKTSLENELREYLGINNIGVGEKKEHLISNEVDANNQIIANSEDCFFDVMNEFCERVQEVFGYPLSVKLNKAEMPSMEESEEEEDVEE